MMLLFISLILFVSRPFADFPRKFLFYSMSVYWVFLLVERLILRQILLRLRANKGNTKTIVLIGNERTVHHLYNLIEKMVEFRISNPGYFVVSPLVINNSLSTYLLQIEGELKLKEYCNADSSHSILWRSGRFAADLHNWFLNNYLIPNKWALLHMGTKPMGMTRFSINSILWFGDEMRKFKGEVPGDDEEFLSCIYPTTQGLANAWNGDAIVAHFAFFTQREELDKMGILERYGEYCLNEWAKEPTMKRISDSIQKVMIEVAQKANELETRPSPYQKVVVKQTIRSKVKKIIPKFILAIRDNIRSKNADINFIR